MFNEDPGASYCPSASSYSSSSDDLLKISSFPSQSQESLFFLTSFLL